MKRLLTFALAVMMLLSVAVVLASCGDDDTTSSGSNSTSSSSSSGNSSGGDVSDEAPNVVVDLADVVPFDGTNYTSFYEAVGDSITIDDVREDPETGLAYVVVNGTKHELGMDFLSMAMVYNLESETLDHDAVYAEWWKYYITRWNYLVPEVPLYSDTYYDVYNTKVNGDSYNTNPYWGTSREMLYITLTDNSNSVIMGSVTELGGQFHMPVFGVTTPNAADVDISNMTTGHETVTTDREGAYVMDTTSTVESYERVENADGSVTYTITLKDGLKFSDGSAITAKNYIVALLARSTPVAAAAGDTGTAGMTYVGWESFNAYTGAGSETGTKYFSGVRLLDTLKFSVQIDSSYLPYFYELGYAALAPYAVAMLLPDGCDIKDDGEGAYIDDPNGAFYAKDGSGSYTTGKDHMADAAKDVNTYPYSGPYMVESYDEAGNTATLKKNPYYGGDFTGQKPSVERVSYILLVSETQINQLTSGQVDIIAGLSGGDSINEALVAVDNSNGKFAYKTYARAGYGKLSFRSDFGPLMFTEVRQAIAYSLDRTEFCRTYTGGYGTVVNGPYYPGSWMYQAVKNDMMLNPYSQDTAEAKAVLEAGGWVYNADGSAYSGTGVRYKKLTAEQAENPFNRNYHSQDNVYKTVKVGDDYYMPLVLNWFSTTDNPVSELLATAFAGAQSISDIGMIVQSTVGDFNTMLGNLYQDTGSGWNGDAVYSVFNLATGYNSAVYDYSWNWTIDPSLYDSYSIAYIKDAADFYYIAE